MIADHQAKLSRIDVYEYEKLIHEQMSYELNCVVTGHEKN